MNAVEGTVKWYVDALSDSRLKWKVCLCCEITSTVTKLQIIPAIRVMQHHLRIQDFGPFQELVSSCTCNAYWIWPGVFVKVHVIK